MARESILDRQYRLARAYFEKEFASMNAKYHGYPTWYPYLIEAHVAGAKAERRAARSENDAAAEQK